MLINQILDSLIKYNQILKIKKVFINNKYVLHMCNQLIVYMTYSPIKSTFVDSK